MQTTIVQKALVFNQQGQLLLLRRSKTDVRRPLQWDFPGGMREEGEELIASVDREIVEESGLKVKGLEPVFTKTDIRIWKGEDKKEHTSNVVFIFYLATAEETEVVLSFEHDKFIWVEASDALAKMQYELHKEVLKHVLGNSLI